MRWQKRQIGEWKIVRRFAWLPVELVDDKTQVWLEHYYAVKVRYYLEWCYEMFATREEAEEFLRKGSCNFYGDRTIIILDPPKANPAPQGALSEPDANGHLSIVK